MESRIVRTARTSSGVRHASAQWLNFNATTRDACRLVKCAMVLTIVAMAAMRERVRRVVRPAGFSVLQADDAFKYMRIQII